MTAQDFGEIISKRRKELSLSQEVFADKLQVSGKTVSRWETGKGFPDIAILPALCEVLDLSYYELFGLPKEKQNPETLEPIVRKVLLELKEQDRKDRKERFQKAMPYVLAAIAVMLMLAGSILMIALKKEQPEESGLSSREESDDYNDTANRALKYLQEGNYKKAYELYEKLWQKENCDNE